jgi:predicted dehydrogenase
VQGGFSYFNRDPQNIRNMADIGGGALYDIGCYPIFTSRFIFGEEPARVLGIFERDPDFRVDRLTSAILDFPSGQAVFTCGMQLVPYQRMNFLGTTGRIEVEIPFNAPPGRPCRIAIDSGGDISGKDIRWEEFPVCDQYTLQGDAFSRAIREGTAVPVPVEEAVLNMAVIEAIFRSGKSRRRELRPKARAYTRFVGTPFGCACSRRRLLPSAFAQKRRYGGQGRVGHPEKITA